MTIVTAGADAQPVSAGSDRLPDMEFAEFFRAEHKKLIRFVTTMGANSDQAAEIDVPGLGGHAGQHRAARGVAGGLGRGDLRAIRPDQDMLGGPLRTGRAPGGRAHGAQRGGGQAGAQHGPAVRMAHW